MRGKHIAKSKKPANIKLLSLILAVVLIVGGVIGGTAAWLTSTPDPVLNTFTYGDVNISLKETDTGLDGDGDPTTNRYKMIPGAEITKDPAITVKAGSEDIYLFVKLEKSANFDSFMEFAIAEGWTPLSGENGVYYRLLEADDYAAADMEVKVIKDNTVRVKSSVNKEMLNALDADPANTSYPTLTVTAYAIQALGSATAAEAWEKLTENI